MPSGEPRRSRWAEDERRPSEDPFLRALQGRLTAVRVPESLRARIGAMLALERASAVLWEPEPD